ncbi:hypothetical protein [Xylanibacter muris]|uniref:OmpA family protein n=1 Tax=Xylanibacter muris TaxID=2736290 RepID=A0ABX2AQ28_9BACT|nr:hypothetical protein [Xylanibacter muris]NPD93230.1 hypothetical protein [Xylanibacter muris]
MKKLLYINKVYTISVLLILYVCNTMTAFAQTEEDDDEMLTAVFDINVKTMNGVEAMPVEYAKFRSYKAALNARNVLRVAIMSQDQLNSDPDAVDKAINRLNITFKKSSNGHFKDRLFVGDAVLVLVDNQFVEAFEIVRGKKEYRHTFKSERTLKEVVVTNELKQKSPVFNKVPPLSTASSIFFDVNINLPAGYVRDDSRLIIQPMAIDCQTEDTIDYLKPIVFEGAVYHKLQNRRTDFNYEKNDPLAHGYVSDVVLKSHTPFSYKTQIEYRKPDKDRTYKGIYYAVLEDFHSPYWVNGGEETGSCLAFTPFKFLDFTVAAKEMPLTEEFMEPAEENYRKVTRELKLKFEVRKDVLTSDSVNQQELHKLISELKSYGDLLRIVTIQGTASPDGNMEQNLELAQKRSQKAISLIREYLPADVRINQKAPLVYTWNDVIEVMKRNGTAKEIIDAVENTVANNRPNRINAVLRTQPFYVTDILPILENQRIMLADYRYEHKHVMNAAEAVDAYYSEKKALLSGSAKFSNGDYYNLFSAIKDSAELDTVTMIAYRHLISQPDYELLALAPYVCNRMALLNIRRGVPDPDVLRPFIDYTKKMGYNKTSSNGDLVMVLNRKEILLNQAICFFQKEKLDTATYLVDMIPGKADTQMLEHFINFQRYYALNILGRLDNPVEKEKLRAAENYVMRSDENKAIVYAEMHSYLKNTRQEVERYVDMLSDSNPKKWYLKGLIWADEAGSEPLIGVEDDGFKELGDAEYLRLLQENPQAAREYDEAREKHDAAVAVVAKNGTPHYLAYFQHSFDLEPKFKRFYFNEGNVSESLRKKYPYKNKDIQQYREKFDMIIADRDMRKQHGVGAAGQSSSSYRNDIEE